MIRSPGPRHPLVAVALLAFLALWPAPADSADFTIARLRYRGGGDWYSDPTSLPNLMGQVEKTLAIATADEEVRIAIMDDALFAYPFIYMTGHGVVDLSDEEASRLRLYLVSGGFLWADDCYGMDASFRKALRKVFPEEELVELPFGHEIYHIAYEFAQGLPKIHEHDGGAPHGYGILHEGRLVVYYSFNTDIGDGLEDPDVHADPVNIREAAMKMATNIVAYALTH
jgi:hypothetical protein